MRTRLFPALRRPVSEVGLGCWQLGGDWGEVDDARAMKILRAAAEQEVTLLDTADVYGAGRSETLIGRFLKSSDARPFVATKIGRFPNPDAGPGFPRANLEPRVMRTHVEASMRRLGVPALDLVQLHCVPADALEDGEVFHTLARLRDEGKVRSYGASVETLAEARTCLRHGVHSLQILFSLFRQDAADELLDEARRARVAVLARVPLASGLLSGKFTPSTRFGDDDHRRYNRDGAAFHVGETFAGIPFEEALALVDEVRDLCPPVFTLAELALRWILDHEAITAVIPGATDPNQVFENAGASDLPHLDEETHAALDELYRDRVRPLVRGEI